jgi:PAS domain S-box-containing protein
MNGKENDVVQKLNNIVNHILSGKRKLNLDAGDVDGLEDESLKLLAGGVIHLCEQYRDCYEFILDLSSGKLNAESPRMNVFANPFKQLHADLRHLTWQIQEIANGDYDQRVSFSGDFSEAINKMIIALRERQILSERIRENENLFHSIFSTSPDGIVLCGLDHCIINASNAAYRMLQITGDAGGNIKFDDLIHKKDEKIYRKFLDDLLNDCNTTVFAELRIVLPNGASFWSEQNASMLLDSFGNPNGYIIIFRDITERKAAEARLMQYTDELNESNRDKDIMFSIIAHDLKSPFSALLGFSNILKEEANREDASIEKIRNFSNIIHESATKSFDLLMNLLEWSRLQSNKIVVRPEPMNLNDVIISNVGISFPMAVNKNIALKYTTPGDYPLVNDRAIINTILRNLISNAVKYTPQNGHITVSLAQKDGMFLVSVQDSGVGITEENLKNLFHPDMIQSTPGTANEKGTGLGLSLCKDFVNKIGGDIWVESAYGHGATFTFSLKSI